VLFPRATDLSSVGKGGNPHPAAGLAGLVATLLLLAIPAIMVWIGAGLLARPAAALASVVLWAAVAGAIARVFLPPAAALLERRRENLCLVSLGR
jgi:hypothetical protein